MNTIGLLSSGMANADGLVRGCVSNGGSVDASGIGASIIENDSFDSFGNPGPYPTVSVSSGNRFGGGGGGFRTPPMATRGLGSCVAEETVGWVYQSEMLKNFLREGAIVNLFQMLPLHDHKSTTHI